MTAETCPHCGAEWEKHDFAIVQFQCGTQIDRHVSYSWASTLSSNCYLNQLAQKNAEIERLRQSVLDEREACAKIADKIRVRGKVK